MLISKVNLCAINSKKYQTPKKQVFFAGNNISEVKKESTSCSNDFLKNCDGYKTIISYNEIISLKKLAEKSKINKEPDNLAVVFIGDAVGDIILATSQKNLIEGNAKWEDITDDND